MRQAPAEKTAPVAPEPLAAPPSEFEGLTAAEVATLRKQYPDDIIAVIAESARKQAPAGTKGIADAKAPQVSYRGMPPPPRAPVSPEPAAPAAQPQPFQPTADLDQLVEQSRTASAPLPAPRYLSPEERDSLAARGVNSVSNLQ